MNQVEKAARFSELHVKGAPLLLYNAWDTGTAKSILDAGAKAIATSSWAVAEAQGYRDGESIPITFVEQIIARIVSTIDAPVSVPGSIQSTSTPGGSQPFVKLRERRASTSLSMRGQICFWVNNATRQTLLTTLLTARKPMPPQERPASSFRACGTMR